MSMPRLTSQKRLRRRESARSSSPGGAATSPRAPVPPGISPQRVDPACVRKAIDVLSQGQGKLRLSDIERGMANWQSAPRGRLGYTSAMLNNAFLRADNKQVGLLTGGQLWTATRRGQHWLLWQAVVAVACGTRDIFLPVSDRRADTQLIMEVESGKGGGARGSGGFPRRRLGSPLQGTKRDNPPVPRSNVQAYGEEVAAAVFDTLKVDAATGQPMPTPRAPADFLWNPAPKPERPREERTGVREGVFDPDFDSPGRSRPRPPPPRKGKRRPRLGVFSTRAEQLLPPIAVDSRLLKPRPDEEQAGYLSLRDFIDATTPSPRRSGTRGRS
eukprot:Hpha_TRINITY_DN26374_c0_g1::TRINITY_DN26374_c0_g1_i1::g.9442::m.9442